MSESCPWCGSHIRQPRGIRADIGLVCQNAWHGSNYTPAGSEPPDTLTEAELPNGPHYAAFQSGDAGFVCTCGLPWTEGEGCPYVQGAAAVRAHYAAAIEGVAAEWELTEFPDETTAAMMRLDLLALAARLGVHDKEN